jgi:hypothetical protein
MSVEEANTAIADANGNINRGPFEVTFDNFKRRVKPKGIEVTKLMTASPGTDDYDAYMAAYLDDANTTMEVCVGLDNRTVTFYTVKYPAPTATIKE